MASTSDSAPSPWKRRGIILGLAAAGGAGLFASRWYNVSAQVTGTALSVQDAHAQANSGEVVLVDIRRPDEWARTGIGEGALPIDMRREDFTDALLQATAGRTDARVALICARGVRSRKMTERLTAAGFTQIIDVPEGMLGSGAGPGWLRAKLPVVMP
ncbi:MAG: rhodanese-like domain-containing protein [Pseudomonadota bacterium]